ncbi:hypothetical protein CWI61_06185, partial [Neisseria meningitidis]|uniref:pimeloyl-ACP methyl esterase BioG family protein n=1 Tax=Neisseria meningitidis TaxID=487 RepID=UPI000CBE3258
PGGLVSEIQQDVIEISAMIRKERRTNDNSKTQALVISADRSFMPSKKHKYWKPLYTVREIDVGHYLFSRFAHWSFFYKQRPPYEIPAFLVGSEMCIRDRTRFPPARK